MISDRQPVVELLDAEVVAALKKMTPAQRMEQAFSAYRFARQMAVATVRKANPDATEFEIEQLVARRMQRGPA